MTQLNLCDVDFGFSLAGVIVVSAAIDDTTEFDWSEHIASLHAAFISHHESIDCWYEERLHLILDQFSDALQCAIK